MYLYMYCTMTDLWILLCIGFVLDLLYPLPKMKHGSVTNVLVPAKRKKRSDTILSGCVS